MLALTVTHNPDLTFLPCLRLDQGRVRQLLGCLRDPHLVLTTERFKKYQGQGPDEGYLKGVYVDLGFWDSGFLLRHLA